MFQKPLDLSQGHRVARADDHAADRRMAGGGRCVRQRSGEAAGAYPQRIVLKPGGRRRDAPPQLVLRPRLDHQNRAVRRGSKGIVLEIHDLGIQTAIQHLLDAWSETSRVEFDLHMTLGELRLPAAVETTLYRVLQEALTNIVRHAAAGHVSVMLQLGDREVTMLVEDDGRGFPRADAPHPPDRLGLLGIRERLSLVGGSLEIESAPGKGTALYARIPL